MKKSGFTHKHSSNSDSKDRASSRQAAKGAPFLWGAAGLAAGLILMVLIGWWGTSAGWFKGKSNIADNTSDPSKVSLQLTNAPGTAQPASNAQNNGSSGSGGSGGNGSSSGSSGGGSQSNGGTSGGSGSSGSNGGGSDSGDSSTVILSPTIDLADLYKSLYSGLTKGDVLNLAGGIVPTCHSLNVLAVGSEEVCTFVNNDQAVVTTFLNDQLIATAKIGF